jgi:hypothetical protein
MTQSGSLPGNFRQRVSRRTDFVSVAQEEISVMGTLSGYGIGVVVVFAILYGIAWLLGSPLLHGQNVFSAGFVLGMLGTSIAVYLYGYRKVA